MIFDTPLTNPAHGADANTEFLNSLAEDWYGLDTQDLRVVSVEERPLAQEPFAEANEDFRWPGPDYPRIERSVHGFTSQVSLSARQAPYFMD
jgi:hypothetical protein